MYVQQTPDIKFFCDLSLSDSELESPLLPMKTSKTGLKLIFKKKSSGDYIFSEDSDDASEEASLKIPVHP